MASKLKMAEERGTSGDIAVSCRSRIVDAGGRSIHVRHWPGDPARTVVIWHGVTGTGLDHLEMAERLNGRGYQVLAPDSLGCGLSDWVGGDATGYGLAALAKVALAVLDAFAAPRVWWLGLSKGGGLGIRLAAERPARIVALALYDVGPTLPEAVRAGLSKRLASPPRSDDLAAFRARIARMLARAGVDAHDFLLDRLATAWSRRLEDGSVGYHYDPALSRQFAVCPEDFDLWPFWDRIACPTLILRGAHSDVLPEADLHAMLRRNDAARSVLLAGSGHIAFLDRRAQQDPVVALFESVP